MKFFERKNFLIPKYKGFVFLIKFKKNLDRITGYTEARIISSQYIM